MYYKSRAQAQGRHNTHSLITQAEAAVCNYHALTSVVATRAILMMRLIRISRRDAERTLGASSWDAKHAYKTWAVLAGLETKNSFALRTLHLSRTIIKKELLRAARASRVPGRRSRWQENNI